MKFTVIAHSEEGLKKAIAASEGHGYLSGTNWKTFRACINHCTRELIETWQEMGFGVVEGKILSEPDQQEG